MSGPSGITVKGPGWKAQQKQLGLDKKGTLSFTPHGAQRNSEHKKGRGGMGWKRVGMKRNPAP